MSVIDDCLEAVRKVELHDHPTLLRCEATRFHPGDRTGERGEVCGLHAWLFCECCQLLLCDYDAEQPCTVYPYEHKLLSADKAEVA